MAVFSLVLAGIVYAGILFGAYRNGGWEDLLSVGAVLLIVNGVFFALSVMG